MRIGGRYRASDVLGAAFIPMVVLAEDPLGWISYTPVKWLVTSVVGTLIVAAAVFERRSTRVTVDRRIAICGGMLLAWLTVTTVVGVEGRYAWLGTPERHAGLLLWVLCAALFLAAPRLPALVAGTVIAAAGLTWRIGQQHGSRLVGSFGSAAYLGAACTLLLPVAVFVALDRQRRRSWRAAAAVGSLTLTVMLTGSGTRGAWFAIAVVAVVGLARGWRPPATAIGALVLTAVVAAAVLGSAGRVGDAFDSSDAGGIGRLDEWRVGAQTLSHHLLTGVGPEGYRIALADGVDEEYEREHGRDVQPDRAHDGVLDMALVGGLPGGALYVALLVLVGRRLRGRRGVEAAAALGLLGYFVQQLFLFPLAELEPIAWMFAGSLLAVPDVGEQPRATSARTMSMVARTAGAGALVCLAACAGWWGLRDVRADRAAQDACDASARNDPSAVRAHLADALRERDDEVRLQLLAVALSPDPDVVTRALADAVALSPGDPITIRREADAALHLEPSAALAAMHRFVADDPLNAYLQQRLGTAAALAGDDALAESAWLRAETLSPSNPDPPSYLASIYQQQGRLDEALAAVDRALRLSPGDQRLIAGRASIIAQLAAG